MNRINTLFILVSILLIGSISCKKSSDDNNSNPNPNPSTPGQYLSRIVRYYDDGSGTESLKESISYVFDNSKRVVRIIDSTGNGTLNPFQITEYSYQGTDTLPYKSVSTNISETTTRFYTYNSSGYLIRDTSYRVSSSYSISYNQTYTYSGSTITGLRNQVNTNSSGSSTDLLKDTAQTDASGNIISNIKHKNSEMVHSNITWDNHPSPLAKLSNFRSSFIFPFGETFFYELPQYNNRLHITELTTTSGGTTSHYYDEDFTGNYTYNADGYPVQILHPYTVIPGSHDKVLFEYITL